MVISECFKAKFFVGVLHHHGAIVSGGSFFQSLGGDYWRLFFLLNWVWIVGCETLRSLGFFFDDDFVCLGLRDLIILGPAFFGLNLYHYIGTCNFLIF